eukprot:6342079-Prymnesium_polylepis.2
MGRAAQHARNGPTRHFPSGCRPHIARVVVGCLRLRCTDEATVRRRSERPAASRADHHQWNLPSAT